MNPLYSLMESPHRWWLLAGISFVAGCFGGIILLAYRLPHLLGQIWLYACLFAAIAFLVAGIQEWKSTMDSVVTTDERPDARDTSVTS